MRSGRWPAALFVCFVWAAWGAAPAPGQSPPKWRTGIVFVTADSAFHQFIGKEKAFRNARGLDVEFVTLPGGTGVITSIVAGATETVEITPASTLGAVEQVATWEFPRPIVADLGEYAW